MMPRTHVRTVNGAREHARPAAGSRHHPGDADIAALRLAYETPPWRDPTAVLNAVRELAPSVHAVEVFASLGALCVPAFSDACSVTVHEGEDTTSTGLGTSTVRPIALSGRSAVAPDLLVLAIEGEQWRDWPPYTGQIAWQWCDRDRPTRSDKVTAQLLIDRAKALIDTQRLEAALAAEQVRADNLEKALQTSREIGQAIGILMWSRKVTAEQGFDLLRTASQHTHHKLRDVATEVCLTGTVQTFESPPLRPTNPSC
jgi:ANTAR domain-containing protein